MSTSGGKELRGITVRDAASDTRAPGIDAARARARDDVASERWCHLILRRCGLAFRDVQIPAVLDLVLEQMRLRGLTSQSSYYELLSSEPEGGLEWTALVERLLNHETSFFRHIPSFDALRTVLLPELRIHARARRRPLNLWSAGCSTGQEAYSLAMLAMTDEELAGEFTVWGGDISRRSVDVARVGRYGPRAIASIPPEYRRRFLREVRGTPTQEFQIADELRQRVRFMAVNLFAACAIGLNHDVIFCHNVLIYLAPAAATRLVSLLASRLEPGGYLLLGPGEGSSEHPPGLDVVKLNGVRAFRRSGQRTTEARP